jgi:serine protease AprX
VDVAVIDTGVAPVPGLDGRGKVVTGPDLSFDSQNGWPAGIDAYGHGTFMAGLIAGRDAGVSGSAAGCATCLNASGYSDTTKFVGVAPEARIVNVKVGAADGAVDVTQVIAAIDWVTQHAHDPGVNIRVLSLSYGTDSTQNYKKDPLAQAIEQAWKHGIVVVVASGNDGKAVNRAADPGYDPFLIAVAADNPKKTLTPVDDAVPGWAQHGNTNRPIDLVAPGLHVIGPRVPGSYIDTLPSNTGQVGTRFQRGTGTSQATAIVTGVAALVAQKYPGATPDQVKAQLDATGVALSSPEAIAAGQKVHWGHGLPNAAAAIATEPGSLAAGTQTATVSTGKGTLDATRGGVTVTDGGTPLTGDQDIFGQPFDALAMAAQQTAAKAWAGGIWNATRWTGDTWTTDSTGTPAWVQATWTTDTWAGGAWTGSHWRDQAWVGSHWRDRGWTGTGWTGAGWDDARWSDYAWN